MSWVTSSASSSRPWMNSQRGLSGTCRRTIRIAVPRIAPSAKQILQLSSAERVCSAAPESSAPAAAPAQYVPLIRMSIRPRCLAGISSSIAELIAEYSPPIPIPVMNRHAKKNTAVVENAVAAVAAGQLAEQQRAEAGPGDVQRCRQPGDVGRRDVDPRALGGDRARDRADDRHLEPVEDPDGAQADQDLPVPA